MRSSQRSRACRAGILILPILLHLASLGLPTPASAAVDAGGSSSGIPGGSGAGSYEPLPSAGVPLPVADYRDLAVDERRGQVFIAQGPGLPLVVTDLAGGRPRSIPEVTDAADLALSVDGDTLFVAQPDLDQVSALDLATLTVVATYPAAEGTCLTDVTATATSVVAGYRDCGGGSGGVAIWALAGSHPVRYDHATVREPLVVAGAAGRVVVADAASGTATTLDLSGDAPEENGRRAGTGPVRSLTASPDGRYVLAASGSALPDQVLDVDDLSDAGPHREAGPYAVATAWSADGRTVATGTDGSSGDSVRVLAADTWTPTASYRFHPDQHLRSGALHVGADGRTTWAVSSDADAMDVRLHVLSADGAIAPTSTLTLDTEVSPGRDSVTVTATLAGARPGSRVKIVAQRPGGGERVVAWGAVDAQGRLHGDHALDWGTTTFVATYQGDGFYPPAADATDVLR